MPMHPGMLAAEGLSSNAAGEVVLCVGANVGLEHLLDLVGDETVVVEPSAAGALRYCLEHPVVRLVVQLAGLGASGLSALAQFRLLRPAQEIVLLGGRRDAEHLRQTVLDGLPVVTLAQEPAPEAQAR